MESTADDSRSCCVRKSPNILLSASWDAKIADTGLARTLFSKTHLSTLPGEMPFALGQGFLQVMQQPADGSLALMLEGWHVLACVFLNNLFGHCWPAGGTYNWQAPETLMV